MDEVLWRTLIYQGNVFENFEVSTNGKIRNVKTGTIYKTCINPNGYEQVCVSLGCRNKQKSFRVHRAVAETFIPNPDNKSDINHKDGNKQNNNMSNLEWATRSENLLHAVANELLTPLLGIDNPSSKLNADDVRYIREHYIPRDSKFGARALGRKFGINHTSILDIIHKISYVDI